MGNVDVKPCNVGEAPEKSFYMFDYTFKEPREVEFVVQKALAAHDRWTLRNTEDEAYSALSDRDKHIRYLLGQINARTSQLTIPTNLAALQLINKSKNMDKKYTPFMWSFQYEFVNHGSLLRDYGLMPRRLMHGMAETVNDQADETIFDENVTETHVSLAEWEGGKRRRMTLMMLFLWEVRIQIKMKEKWEIF
ncbi:hypothetical protein BCR33DRAFT_334866 [Rhizoclosmatium globosum]|uniref:Uncharacterized protein n=1 Tax=Rhizoclosmatium globosum TaxID=329046 RepID=A0A1Y2C3R8_9FUNG|nr:hypothetical protein BCR33DRAFT_334866 [Rhizoclosmatium globosum]|eukprot:ORY41537.1 hypothetical protein BCR33DRAFT_334866 [Rhizoclosmatium globosum]